MTQKRNGTLLIASMALFLFLAGCASPPQVRGSLIDEKLLNQIQPGSSAEEVILTLGSPPLVSTVGDKTYYYVQQTLTQKFAFLTPKVIKQRVIAIHLDEENRVAKIEKYTLKDGQNIAFATDETRTSGGKASLLRQLISGTHLSPALPIK